ncbi:MAG: DUF2149 domain-containing protein [Bacteroidales bacterium]|nr:DUF2149 domain-containing protein [Bacteroidales bacterium]
MATTFDQDEDVNPMGGLSNLADAMLVLAVGLMIALMAAWSVDIVNDSPNETSVDAEEASELEDYENLYRNIDQSEEVEQEDEGLTEYGTVYIDENGNLYVLEN